MAWPRPGDGRHRREADLPEADLLGEVPVDPLDVERSRRQRDARADRPAAMPLEQLLDLRRDDVVAAGAVVEHAELVLHLARTVDRDRDADLVLGEELDDLRLEQRGVGREAEVDRLAQLGAALARVGDRLLQDRKVQQRFAAEERDVRDLVVARFLEHELHALARGLLAHELRLHPVFGVDDLVLAVLVAVGAGQVALIRDVEHHRRQRKRRQRQDFRRRSGVGARHDQLADGAHARQLRDRVLQLRMAVPFRQLRFQFVAGVGTLGQPPHDGVGGVVEREDRGARDEVDERPSRRLEAMMFPRGPADHCPPPNHAM